jgi:enolase
MSEITKIYARQILDSRGNPTVEAEVTTSAGAFGRASVPSGASTGSKEAVELRDGDSSYYLGKSVRMAVRNVNEVIATKLKGHDCFDQTGLDQIMLDLDGTENKSNLGANALLAVSLANARAGANESELPLFSYLRDKLNCPNSRGHFCLPTPLMNIINGGQHASNNLDIQEFMIVPHMKESFADNFRAGVEVFHHLKSILNKQGFSTNVGDEGGFAPDLESHEMAIELILSAIEKAGLKPGKDMSLSFDAAASEFYREGRYHMQGQGLDSEQMIEYYSNLSRQYPIYSLEDGLDEADYEGWVKLTRQLGEKMLLVGDDLFVTNKKILARGIEQKQANSILVKVNQIGTLSETFETLDLAFKNNFAAIISHRSGETGDAFIADLSVACGSGHIKTGSASRSDRMEKYNQLLRIEEALQDKAKFYPVRS